jgi:hypothetical protein
VVCSTAAERTHTMADSMDVDQGHQPNKRLMIREMVLENFKSYAGAQHVGPFHKVRRRSTTPCASFVCLKQHTVCAVQQQQALPCLHVWVVGLAQCTGPLNSEHGA